MEGVLIIDDLIAQPDSLFATLDATVQWDTRMASRKTASFGVAYNYSQIHYPFQPFITEIEQLSLLLEDRAGFLPNNCLINYYPDGTSKMGYHSDQTDILEPGTGIAIISIGTPRTLRFRNIAEPALTVDHELRPGGLFYMSQQVQHEWQHALLVSPTTMSRMSLTFRRMRTSNE